MTREPYIIDFNEWEARAEEKGIFERFNAMKEPKGVLGADYRLIKKMIEIFPPGTDNTLRRLACMMIEILMMRIHLSMTSALPFELPRSSYHNEVMDLFLGIAQARGMVPGGS